MLLVFIYSLKVCPYKFIEKERRWRRNSLIFLFFLLNLDPTNPIAYTLSYITGNQNEDVIIPCKPTSKQFQVQLFKEGDEVTKPHNIYFDDWNRGGLSLPDFQQIINNSRPLSLSLWWFNCIFLELHIIQTFLVQTTIISGDFNAYIGTRIKNLQQNDATDYYCRLNKFKQQFTLNVRRMCISILNFLTSIHEISLYIVFLNFMRQNIACSQLLLLKKGARWTFSYYPRVYNQMRRSIENVNSVNN